MNAQCIKLSRIKETEVAMKKGLLVMVLGFLVFIVSQAYAVSVTYSVQVQALSVSADWVVAFSTPTLSAASTFNIYSGSVAVQNTGNVAEDYILSCANSGDWSVTGSTPNANNVFRLMGLFNSTEPSAGDYDVYMDTMTTTAQTSSASYYAGDQAGNNVAADAWRALWVSFCAPTGTPVATRQDIVLTIDCQATP